MLGSEESGPKPIGPDPGTKGQEKAPPDPDTKGQANVSPEPKRSLWQRLRPRGPDPGRRTQ